MHFGRVENDRDLDLHLPPDGSRTRSYLGLGHGGRGLLYCGAPIWACNAWVPQVYPEKAKPSQYLRYYAQQYSLIELNSSFYHLPSHEQVRMWLKQTGPEFRFLPKMPKHLSHNLKGPLDNALLKNYLDLMATFGEKLGLSFLQLPEWFTAQDFAYLERFISSFSRDFPLAIEFRHPSWFQDGMLRDPVINFLYRQRLGAVITDTPGAREVLHMSLTSPQVLVRFQGCFPSKKDNERLKAWLDRLCSWLELGLDSAYLAIHQPRDGAIPSTVDFALRYLYQKAYPRTIRPDLEDAVEEG